MTKKLIDKVIKVESCGYDCPFYEYQDEMMTHSCKAVENDLSFSFDKKAEKLIYDGKPYLHPECPLRKGKILVELKN
jgi:hypothetical protein